LALYVLLLRLSAHVILLPAVVPLLLTLVGLIPFAAKFGSITSSTLVIVPLTVLILATLIVYFKRASPDTSQEAANEFVTLN